jgi:hypothetical protein
MNNKPNNVLLPRNDDAASLGSIDQISNSYERVAREDSFDELDCIDSIVEKLEKKYPTMSSTEIHTFAVDVIQRYISELGQHQHQLQRYQITTLELDYSNRDILLNAIKECPKKETTNEFIEDIVMHVREHLTKESQAEHGEDEMIEDQFPAFINESRREQSRMNFANIQQQAPNNNLQQQNLQQRDPNNVSSHTRSQIKLQGNPNRVMQ